MRIFVVFLFVFKVAELGKLRGRGFYVRLFLGEENSRRSILFVCLHVFCVQIHEVCRSPSGEVSLPLKSYRRYFRIFGMESQKVEERTTFLLQFLDLPLKWRLIMNLSGGQQRYTWLNGWYVNITK